MWETMSGKMTILHLYNCQEENIFEQNGITHSSYICNAKKNASDSIWRKKSWSSLV